MRMLSFLPRLCVALCVVSAFSPGGAQAQSAAFTPVNFASPSPGYSSSEQPDPVALPETPVAPAAFQAEPARRSANNGRFLSAIGIQLKAGVAGAGIDVAVPLAEHFNLRVGGSFFQYSGSYAIDGITVDGEAKFRSGTVQIDYFPFHNGFRLSPGVTVYNGNNLNASAVVPGGQSFDLGDNSYTSSATDPVHGTASMTFGNRTAPSFTLGWGNLIPRKPGRHLSIPFEIGFQYIKDPRINMDLEGTACSYTGGENGCGNLKSDPVAQDYIQQELRDLQNDISPLRFYPIISIGVGWAFKFGS